MIDRRALLVAMAGLGVPRAVAASLPYRARLIGGETNADAWTAGIDVVLEEGWKTYWRVPGEAGIPPSFDWTGSKNAKSIEVLWPVPHRFNDVAGEAIGYKGRVVFPVRVMAESGAAPQLQLSMFFGVCKEICIPARYSGTLTPGQALPEDLSLIQTYLARVPERRSFVASARISDGALRLAFAGEAPADPDLFVESDTLAYFRAPRASGDGYALPIDGLKDPLALRGKTLRVTLVAGDRRLEQSVTVE
jgi:DsbC/DsbD-like thiol-disulfide interchange protein